MDLSYFIKNKERIEPALKSGLYCIMQSHLPRSMQAFRCGLAGKPLDTAQQVSNVQSSFASRFATYMNYYLPTNCKVFCVLTVERRQITGYTERVLPTKNEADNREDYARLSEAKTLIEIREAQYHILLQQNGMYRLSLDEATPLDKRRSEFFKPINRRSGNGLDNVITSLKQIGQGTLYLFTSNNITSIKKIVLNNAKSEIITKQIKLRQSPRLLEVEASKNIVDKLLSRDTQITQSLNRLRDIRAVQRDEKKRERLLLEAKQTSITPLQASLLTQIRRRSPRIRNANT